MLHEVLAGITEHVQGHISAVTYENLKMPLNIKDQFDHFKQHKETHISGCKR